MLPNILRNIFKLAESIYDGLRENDTALVSLDTDGEWHNFSSQITEFRAPRDELNTKQALLTGQGLRPNFHTVWPYE